jgi:hypothetical protein
MKDCIGEPLNEDNQDLVPPNVLRKQMKVECCRVYDVYWNGRWVKDVICSNAFPPQCQANIKIIRATIYKRCFVYNMNALANYLTNKNTGKYYFPKF